MTLKEIITEIRRAAFELNMEVAEYLEWVEAEHNKKLPYEGIIGYASKIKRIALELFAPEKLE